jgi:Flp pilus assembly pilin Flp
MALSCHSASLPSYWFQSCGNLLWLLNASWVVVHFRWVLTQVIFGACVVLGNRRYIVANLLNQLWNDEQGQDIAEYAVMLAVILVIVVGTVRLIGSNANTVFSQVGSAIQ